MNDDNRDGVPSQLNIDITDDVAEGDYSNLVMVAHSPEEFILDFIRVMPGVSRARVRSRVIVSPGHARRLLRALNENIERYERAYGEIEDRNPPDHPVQYGGGQVGEA